MLIEAAAALLTVAAAAFLWFPPRLPWFGVALPLLFSPARFVEDSERRLGDSFEAVACGVRIRFLLSARAADALAEEGASEDAAASLSLHISIARGGAASTPLVLSDAVVRTANRVCGAALLGAGRDGGLELRAYTDALVRRVALSCVVGSLGDKEELALESLRRLDAAAASWWSRASCFRNVRAAFDGLEQALGARALEAFHRVRETHASVHGTVWWTMARVAAGGATERERVRTEGERMLRAMAGARDRPNGVLRAVEAGMPSLEPHLREASRLTARAVSFRRVLRPLKAGEARLEPGDLVATRRGRRGAELAAAMCKVVAARHLMALDVAPLFRQVRVVDGSALAPPLCASPRELSVGIRRRSV